MALTREQFDLQRVRLDRAVRDLRTGGSLLHAIARGYYLIYVTVTYVANKHGVTFIQMRPFRSGIESDNFSHNSIGDVVQVLYTGNKRGRVSPGQTPGIGSGHFSDRDAAKAVDLLQRDQKAADYGPTKLLEPYTAAEADVRLSWAKNLCEDLEGLM